MLSRNDVEPGNNMRPSWKQELLSSNQIWEDENKLSYIINFLIGIIYYKVHLETSLFSGIWIRSKKLNQPKRHIFLPESRMRASLDLGGLIVLSSPLSAANSWQATDDPNRFSKMLFIFSHGYTRIYSLMLGVNSQQKTDASLVFCKGFSSNGKP